MLNNEAAKNIELIENTAVQVWAGNVEFDAIRVLNSPYPEFEWVMTLYQKIDVLIHYDRSALDIGIPKNGQHVLMSEFTDKSIVRGMKSTQPENLLYNFRVLDDIVKKLSETQNIR